MSSMTFAFFCLSALDLLGGTLQDRQRIPNEEIKAYRDWIWSQQAVSDNEDSSSGGFRGSPSLPTDSGHLAMTYTALLCLALLEDDFTRLDKPKLCAFLRSLQQSDGSFAPAHGQQECDPRFTFCAFAISWIIDDWSGVDVERALQFLETCKAYDGAYAQGPHQESHGGSTYCVVASYALAERVEELKRDARLLGWLVDRQQGVDDMEGEQAAQDEDEDEDVDGTPATSALPGSFNGRINKPGDSCYSFWCGASLDVSDDK